MIKGETVILIDRTETGKNPFGEPIYAETQTAVNNVVIGNPSTDDVVSELDLSGKRIAFVLGIPKTDTNDWKDKVILIRGERFKSFGFPLTQTAANVPGAWNTQVKVERYE